MNERERILIVDDEMTIRRLLLQKLSRQGYNCEEAVSVEHALDKMRSHPVELAILDIKLPGRSGVDLLEEMKTRYPGTAVIMTTAVTETSMAIECMKQGADDYICKPFNLDELILSVDKTLEKRRLELEIKEYQEHLQQKADQRTIQIRQFFLGSIKALVVALEAKDKYTEGHSRRVTEIALAIGRELGLHDDDLENLRWGSLLHDVGKIAVSRFIQNKPAKLTPEEYEHIMIHANVGAGIVSPVVNERIVEIIEHHHDHYDGTGLHQLVAGKDIPIGARILAVADAFDAMTSDRPYRSALSIDEAVDEMRRCNGTQFDPTIVDAFMKAEIPRIVPTHA